MKNSLKIGLLGIVMAGTLVACDPPKGNSSQTPGDSSKKAIDTSKAAIDTAKKDTSKK